MTLTRVDITSPFPLPHYHERSIGPKVAFAAWAPGCATILRWVECHGRNGDCPLVRSLAKAGA